VLSDGARKEDICTLQYFTKIPHLKASKRRSPDQRGLLPQNFLTQIQSVRLPASDLMGEHLYILWESTYEAKGPFLSVCFNSIFFVGKRREKKTSQDESTVH
jgi:hypothetical protein